MVIPSRRRRANDEGRQTKGIQEEVRDPVIEKVEISDLARVHSPTTPILAIAHDQPRFEEIS